MEEPKFDPKTFEEARNYISLLKSILNLGRTPQRSDEVPDTLYIMENPDAAEEDREVEDYDSRDMRTVGSKICRMKKHIVDMGEGGYEYRPNRMERYDCTEINIEHFYNRRPSPAKRTDVKYCRHSRECTPKYREPILFRRIKGKHCWEPHSKNISDGCNCEYPESISEHSYLFD